jgi:hypothetical protein
LQKETQVATVMFFVDVSETKGKARGDDGSEKHPPYTKGVKSVQNGPRGVPHLFTTPACAPGRILRAAKAIKKRLRLTMLSSRMKFERRGNRKFLQSVMIVEVG